jgi:hypothetical protein
VPSRKKDRFLFAHLFRDITTRCRSIGSPPSVVPHIPPTLPLSELEREVLRLPAGGKTSKERTRPSIGRSSSGRNEGMAAVGIHRTVQR